MWALVLCLLPGARTRKDHSILIAAVAIAAALSLNVDAIYAAGDAAIGGRNLLDLCASILMVVGIYFLSQAILRAAELSDAPARRDRRGLLILGLVSVGLVLSFLGISAPRSSTRFMLDYGGQPAAAVYSAIQFSYIGVVVSVTGYVCFRFRRRMAASYFRVAFTLVGLGCALALVLVLAVLGMDIAHLMGDHSTMANLAIVYDLSFVGSMVFLCAGLALKPVVDKVIAGLDGLVDSAGVSVVPGVLADADSWHQWWSLVKGKLVFIPHNLNPASIKYYDYTNMTWFERPAASGGPELTGPYIDFGGADVKVVTASRPVLRGNETVAVAGADLSLEQIQRSFLLGLGRRDEHIALITETGKIVASNSARFAPGTRYEGEREGPVPVAVPSLASPPCTFSPPTDSALRNPS